MLTMQVDASHKKLKAANEEVVEARRVVAEAKGAEDDFIAEREKVRGIALEKRVAEDKLIRVEAELSEAKESVQELEEEVRDAMEVAWKAKEAREAARGLVAQANLYSKELEATLARERAEKKNKPEPEPHPTAAAEAEAGISEEAAVAVECEAPEQASHKGHTTERNEPEPPASRKQRQRGAAIMVTKIVLRFGEESERRLFQEWRGVRSDRLGLDARKVDYRVIKLEMEAKAKALLASYRLAQAIMRPDERRNRELRLAVARLEAGGKRYALHSALGEALHQRASKEESLRKTAELHIELAQIKEDLGKAKISYINALAEKNLESSHRDQERARAEFIDVKLQTTGQHAEALRGEVETSQWEARELQAHLLAAREERDATKEELLEAKTALSQEQRRYWKELQEARNRPPSEATNAILEEEKELSRAQLEVVPFDVICPRVLLCVCV